jgi:hypothetical protein
MDFSQVRELVKNNPKRIGDFVREKMPNSAIKNAQSVNFVRYNYNSSLGKTCQYGYSIGDGCVYGHKIVKAIEGVWIDQPNTEIVCYQPPSNSAESFEMHV